MSIVVKSRCAICHPEKVTNNKWDMCDKCNTAKMKNLMHKSVRDVKARPVDKELGDLIKEDKLNSQEMRNAMYGSSKEVGMITANIPKEEPVNLYKREILPGVWIDFYDIVACYEMTDHAMAHALKKMLAMGNRGYKDEAQDRKDIYDSVVRSNERFDLFNKIG